MPLVASRASGHSEDQNLTRPDFDPDDWSRAPVHAVSATGRNKPTGQDCARPNLPGQQLTGSINLMVGDAAENIGQPSLWIDVIEFGRLNERVGNGSGSAAVVRAHEQIGVGASDKPGAVPFSTRRSLI